MGSRGNAQSRHSQMSEYFCLIEDQENRKTVQWTVFRKKPYQGFLESELREPF